MDVEDLKKEIKWLQEERSMLMKILECARMACHQPVGKEHYWLDEAIKDYDDHSFPRMP